MKTVYEVKKEQLGEDKFEVIIREDGTREYRSWKAASISCEGKVTSLGVMYNKFVTIVTPDDMTVIDVLDMDEDLYEELYFVESPEKWAAIHKIDATGLIGLSSDKFYAEVSKRCQANKS
jgi:hypothetical protein